jgi:hypothetical protein
LTRDTGCRGACLVLQRERWLEDFANSVVYRLCHQRASLSLHEKGLWRKGKWSMLKDGRNRFLGILRHGKPKRGQQLPQSILLLHFLIKTSDLNHLNEVGPTSAISHHMSMDKLRDLYHLLPAGSDFFPFCRGSACFRALRGFSLTIIITDIALRIEVMRQNILFTLSPAVLSCPLNWCDMPCIARRTFL